MKLGVIIPRGFENTGVLESIINQHIIGIQKLITENPKASKQFGTAGISEVHFVGIAPIIDLVNRINIHYPIRMLPMESATAEFIKNYELISSKNSDEQMCMVWGIVNSVLIERTDMPLIIWDGIDIVPPSIYLDLVLKHPMVGFSRPSDRPNYDMGNPNALAPSRLWDEIDKHLAESIVEGKIDSQDVIVNRTRHTTNNDAKGHYFSTEIVGTDRTGMTDNEIMYKMAKSYRTEEV